MSQANQMTPKLPVILACALAALVAPGKSFANAKDQCSWTRPKPNWTHFYNGRLSNGIVVRVTLRFHNCRVTGTWFDSLFFKDFRISGSIFNDHKATLAVTSGDGHVIAKLRGRFFQHDPFGVVRGGEMGTGILLGHSSGTGALNGQTITLRETRFWNGTDNDVAASVGIKNMVLHPIPGNAARILRKKYSSSRKP